MKFDSSYNKNTCSFSVVCVSIRIFQIPYVRYSCVWDTAYKAPNEDKIPGAQWVSNGEQYYSHCIDMMHDTLQIDVLVNCFPGDNCHMKIHVLHHWASYRWCKEAHRVCIMCANPRGERCEICVKYVWVWVRFVWSLCVVTQNHLNNQCALERPGSASESTRLFLSTIRNACLLTVAHPGDADLGYHSRLLPIPRSFW